jgi:thiol-disulfide isomerase/thioredoxin
MKKLCYLLCFMALPCLLSAQTQERHLWGVVTRDSLLQEPYSVWFKKNYDDYKPTLSVIAQLKTLKVLNNNDLRIKVFFGTWCGDTKREMPRLLKVLDEMGFPNNAVEFIALSSDDKTYKQSKNREERGYNIFRVGCFVIEQNGVELNRIYEFPVLSMERDLLTILSKQPYTPNYAVYPMILQWVKDGWLADDNVSPQSLAALLKNQVRGTGELNALGYAWLADGKTKEAVKIFRVNANLFGDNSGVYHSLAEGWLKLGEKEKALSVLAYGLQINKEPQTAQQFLDLQKEILTK